MPPRASQLFAVRMLGFVDSVFFLLLDYGSADSGSIGEENANQLGGLDDSSMIEIRNRAATGLFAADVSGRGRVLRNGFVGVSFYMQSILVGRRLLIDCTRTSQITRVPQVSAARDEIPELTFLICTAAASARVVGLERCLLASAVWMEMSWQSHLPAAPPISRH